MLDLISKLMRMNAETQNLDNELVNSEVNYISSTLELMRDVQQISNDAYLDSGSIQGGLSVISSLLEQGISDSEIDLLLNTLFERAKILDLKYPKLNKLVESYRNN